MKFNIILLIFTFIVLIACYFNRDKFFRENAKILTSQNGKFNFIDSDILFETSRKLFSGVKKVLVKQSGWTDFTARADDFVNPESTYHQNRGNCARYIRTCPHGSVSVEDNSQCMCAYLRRGSGWDFNDLKISI